MLKLLKADAALTQDLDAGGQHIVNLSQSTDSGSAVPYGQLVSYVNGRLVGVQVISGSIDCSTNPNYPAASKGNGYYVSVAGKIGGASGTVVQKDDLIVALADNAGGTQAAVGGSWTVAQGNLIAGIDYLTPAQIAAAYAPISVIYNAGNISGAVTLDRANGDKQNATATGNVTLNVSNGSDFSSLELWIVASGADRTLDKNTAVKLSGDSGVSFPVTLPSGTGATVLFKKHGALWYLVTLVKNNPTA